MQTQNEFEQQCDAARKAARFVMVPVLIIPAAIADDLGAQGLQLVASRSGRKVITEPESRYHNNRLFRPEAA